MTNAIENTEKQQMSMRRYEGTVVQFSAEYRKKCSQLAKKAMLQKANSHPAGPIVLRLCKLNFITRLSTADNFDLQAIRLPMPPTARRLQSYQTPIRPLGLT